MLDKKVPSNVAAIILVFVIGMILLVFFMPARHRAGQEALMPQLAMLAGDSYSPSQGKFAEGQVEAADLTDIERRRIIKTARLEIESKPFREKCDEITAIVEEAGGFILSSSMSLLGEGRKSGKLIAKVPVSKFQNVLEKLGRVGKVKSKSVTGQDVTEEYFDLKARVKNLSQEEERILQILKKAEKIEDILSIERELTRVRGEIEKLTGRLRYLRSRTDFSTVEIQLYEPLSVVKTSKWSLPDTLREASRAFIIVCRKFISLLTWIVIFTPFMILIWIVAKVLGRRTIRRKTE
jgi:hypothetical protein